jgi:hypothetical protein
MRPLETPNVWARTRGRQTVRYQIEDEMASPVQIFKDSKQRFSQIVETKNVIQGIKVCGYQIHRARQSQTANVLPQQHDICLATVPRCYSQHRLREVNSENGNTARCV